MTTIFWCSKQSRCYSSKRYRAFFSQAFDSVAWSFLLEVLEHLGLGPSWCNLISCLLSTAPTHVMVNGEPRDQIGRRRGLRQGGPLSPFLFILVMDVFNSLFTKASDLDLLLPLSRWNLGQRIYLYAEDVVLFIRPVEEEMNLTMEKRHMEAHV